MDGVAAGCSPISMISKMHWHQQYPLQLLQLKVSVMVLRIYSQRQINLMLVLEEWPTSEYKSTRDSWATRSGWRSEEHTSELQSLMRISYAVFCLQKKHDIINKKPRNKHYNNKTE